jgi:hypothetical protein
MNPSELLKTLSNKLNLQFEPQDWGIINADSNRFEEFLSFYENHPDLHLTQKYQLCDLIIASYNEAMIEKKLAKKDLDELIKFISNYKHIHSELIEYWSSLTDSDEFPVVKVINDINKYAGVAKTK